MSNNVFHSGVIDHIKDHTIFVRITRQSACSGCHARSMCSVSESRDSIIEVIDHSGMYKENEEVIICGQSSLGLQAVFLAFIIPLLIVIAAIAISMSANRTEIFSGSLGLLLLIPYYCTLYLMRNKLRKRFVFTLKKINGNTL